jgi:hypothetical protein
MGDVLEAFYKTDLLRDMAHMVSAPAHTFMAQVGLTEKKLYTAVRVLKLSVYICKYSSRNF